MLNKAYCKPKGPLLSRAISHCGSTAVFLSWSPPTTEIKIGFFILHFPNEPVANFLVHAVWCWAGMHSEFVIAYLMRTAAYCCRKDSWQKWLKLLLSVSLWDVNH